ncbi:MAG: O-antigen ligase family protein [Flavobacteriaceae bacterium]|nr:O-antigen ligase family protein [Flavobacteriaceae bacterium]
MGITAILTPYVIIGWFYLVLLTSFIYVLKERYSVFPLVGLILYLVSFELLSRMAQTFPFIPYELGKYLLFVALIFGIVRYQTIGFIGWVMLFCMVPALFIDISGRVQSSDIIFNILGPMNVALAITLFNKKPISSKDLSIILRLMLYPILGVLAYTLLKSPDFDEVEFSLGGNVDLSGGFGSNQVSTLFGLGTLFIFILLINKWKFSGYFIIDLLILFALSFQGLLTFSRGGMLGALLGVIVVLFFVRTAPRTLISKYKLPKVGKYVLPGILIAGLSFFVVNEITGGLLTLRYQGETMGTLQGTKERTLYTITTGRLDIFIGDVNLWFEHFLFGVGAGASRFLRETLTGTVAHVEVSRLLAEHGFLGFIYFILLCWIGLAILKYNENPMIKGILFAFYLVGVYTSFHAAMRTYVTPALIGLSVLMIRKPQKKTTKRIKKKIDRPQLILEK